MPYGRAYAFSSLALVTVLAFPANPQSVISTRSGVIHFFEGAVYLGDVPLAPRLGKFPRMAEGSELRTAQGRAEVLLTPGVFVRTGERSAIRLVGNYLADTRVELLAGSAILAERVSGGSHLDGSVEVPTLLSQKKAPKGRRRLKPGMKKPAARAAGFVGTPAVVPN